MYLEEEVSTIKKKSLKKEFKPIVICLKYSTKEIELMFAAINIFLVMEIDLHVVIFVDLQIWHCQNHKTYA